MEFDDFSPKCSICEDCVGIYKCPSCSVRTCSLKCCSSHKLQSGCTGKRNKSSYVPLSTFNESTLINDYHFLEDVLQSKISSKRLLNNGSGSSSNGNDRSAQRKNRASVLDPCHPWQAAVHSVTTEENVQVPVRENEHVLSKQDLSSYTPAVKKLVKAAEVRGTHLVVMPSGMSRRMSNTTRFQHKNDKIFWKVHMVFLLTADFTPQSLLELAGDHNRDFVCPEGPGGAVVSSVLTEVEENTTISELLSRLVDPSQGKTLLAHALRPIRRQRDGLRCVIQRLPSRADNLRFIEIPIDFSLKDCLKGKTVIEYPTIIVGPAAYTGRLNTLVTELAAPVSEKPMNALATGEAVDVTHNQEGQACCHADSSTNQRDELNNNHSIEDKDGHVDDDDRGGVICEPPWKMQRVQSRRWDDSLTGLEKESLEEDCEEDEEYEVDEDFLASLKELEGTDIAGLQAVVMREELLD